ncbi:hypothetical protein C8J57DRAFT_1635615 [Mycena rebaudengoi]|nr:hypothetical protein C8J57DRAFT_1635615 [Mycena rebaudengoi]
MPHCLGLTTTSAQNYCSHSPPAPPSIQLSDETDLDHEPYRWDPSATEGSRSATPSETNSTPAPSAVRLAGLRSASKRGSNIPPVLQARKTKTTLSARTERRKEGKKSAFTEEERKRALESDPWTLSVELNQVVCRGCHKTIRLDRRSRYYPGLWQKHRDRCAQVRKLKEALSVRSDSPVSDAGMESSDETGAVSERATPARCTVPTRRMSKLDQTPKPTEVDDPIASRRSCNLT